MEYKTIRSKVLEYNKILKNTTNYRKEWSDNLKGMIMGYIESYHQGNQASCICR